MEPEDRTEQRYSTPDEADHRIFCNIQWNLRSAMIYGPYDPGIASYAFVTYRIMSRPLCTHPNRLLDVSLQRDIICLYTLHTPSRLALEITYQIGTFAI